MGIAGAATAGSTIAGTLGSTAGVAVLGGSIGVCGGQYSAARVVRQPPCRHQPLTWQMLPRYFQDPQHLCFCQGSSADRFSGLSESRHAFALIYACLEQVKNIICQIQAHL